MLKATLKNISNDFALGNISKANSQYLRILNELAAYPPFVSNVKNVLKLQENEDWVGLADAFEDFSNF